MCRVPPRRVGGRPGSPASLSWASATPGFGNSAPAKEASTEAGRAELLARALRGLEVRNAVLVSPSLSGRYALPFLMRDHPQLRGFVPIAPAATQNYTREQFWAVKVLGGGGHPSPGSPPGGKGLRSHLEDSPPYRPPAPIWMEKMSVWGGFPKEMAGGPGPGRPRITALALPCRPRRSSCTGSWTASWRGSPCGSSATCPSTRW